jgi:N-acetylated-alpha-linked acidic dipeptidase
MYYFGKGIYPVYHSVHDTYKWLQGLVDPDFSYQMTTTQVAARALMSTADSIVLPLDVRQYAKSLRKSLQKFNETYGVELSRNNITLKHIDTAITR